MGNLYIYNTERAVVTVIYLVILAAAALQDRKTRKIPDRLVLSLGLCGLFSIPFYPEITLMERMTGVFCVSLLLVGITVLAPGSFGGGDIKLMAAGGIFLGWKHNADAFIIALMLAGIYCVIMLLLGKVGRKSKVAFGPFLCIGIMIEVIKLLFI